MIREAISKVAEGMDLSLEEMMQVVTEIVEARATESQIAAFLTALKMKGEKPEEVVGALNVIKEKAKKVFISHEPLIDIVGTGGDGGKTFNISTVSAIVLAGGGVKVAKHGNRAASSLCGSADLLEFLGANISPDGISVERLIDTTGFVFLFAPFFHPALKHAQKVRQDIGIRTIFNIVGPLANPASPTHMLLGVAKPDMAKIYAEVLTKTKVKKAAVFFSSDGLDEISVAGETTIFEIKGNNVEKYTISPEDFGFKKAKKEDLKGGGPLENAIIAKKVLSGEEKGPKRDIVLLNSGYGFYLIGKTKSVKEGIKYAEEIIDSGCAIKVLETYIEESKKCF
ncbi:MAG: anthranilate phosphoribosyltransferase [Deltaproteobacteria bacterium]|nr:anthranilate phosphoribosyltransferase [Deltaproteobacteria bacterium]